MRSPFAGVISTMRSSAGTSSVTGEDGVAVSADISGNDGFDNSVEDESGIALLPETFLSEQAEKDNSVSKRTNITILVDFIFGELLFHTGQLGQKLYHIVFTLTASKKIMFSVS
jgi:hypothetical protein